MIAFIIIVAIWAMFFQEEEKPRELPGPTRGDIILRRWKKEKGRPVETYEEWKAFWDEQIEKGRF